MKTKILLLLALLLPAAGLFGQDTIRREIDGNVYALPLDETHRLLDAYATAEDLKNPRVAAALQTLGELSADRRTLTLPTGTTVWVAPGVYWTDETYRKGFPFDESGFVLPGPNVGLTIVGEDISFIGLTGDPADVRICGNRGEGGARGLGADGGWYTLAVSGGFRAENLTIANYAQQALVYPRDPSRNMPERIDSRNHAEVLRGAGGRLDRIVFRNVRFTGYLNMMAGFSPARAWFEDCVLQCTDDSVFGGGVVAYENCTFLLHGNHPSASGAGPGGIAALLGCRMVGMPQMTGTTLSLSKVSRGSGAEASSIFAVIDTEFLGRIEAVEWENVVRGDARHAVSGNTLGTEKKPLVISPSEPRTSVELSAGALRAFKVDGRYNIYNLLKGDDGWNPAGLDTAEWAAYSNLPYRFLVGTENKTLYSDRSGEDNRAVLTPAPAPAGSVGAGEIRWDYDTTLLEGAVDPATGILTLTARPNRSGAIVRTTAAAALPNGLTAGAALSILPLPVAAPVLAAPGITIENGFAVLDYTPDRPEYRDVSTIEWYRETGPAATGGIHVGTMRNDSAGLFVDEPYREYALNGYDAGTYLRAVITPKYAFSPAGEPVTVYTGRPVAQADIAPGPLATDFKNLHITREDRRSTVGRWFFDSDDPQAVEPWGWGIGTNGADGRWGLMNRSHTAASRLVFARPGNRGGMRLTLDYSPGKVEGQGFGGNGNYLDIYIKYDPAARTGYGLRVERIPASSNATRWTLMRYDGDRFTPLTEGTLTAAFMPRSTIVLSAEGNVLRVGASTRSEPTPLHLAQNLPTEVELSWTDPSGELGKNADGGFGLRIDNSGNASYVYAGFGTDNCVMLHRISVEAVEK